MDFLSQCTSGGCGAKIGSDELKSILLHLPKITDKQLLVGYDSADDAAVYQLSSDLAVISTVDFFSPMIEDPATFGKIAVANALSDIYAMGGEVLFVLNLVCFPERMDKSKLAAILHGGSKKLHEAGVSLAGGHSIYDHEVKYGLSVTGKIHPKNMLRNNTPQVDDILILTKALGVGLILSALRGNVASDEAQNAAIHSMEKLNKYASESIRPFDVHACTDVTGFGLLVHACEMASKNTSLVIDTTMLPILPEAYSYAEDFLATAGAQRNRRALKGAINLESISLAMQELLFDPQTSGGLLISVAPKHATQCLDAIHKNNPEATIIGVVKQRELEEQPVILL